MSEKKLSKKEREALKAKEQKKWMKSIMKPVPDLSEKYAILKEKMDAIQLLVDEADKFAKDNQLVYVPPIMTISRGDTDYDEDDYDDYIEGDAEPEYQEDYDDEYV